MDLDKHVYSLFIRSYKLRSTRCNCQLDFFFLRLKKLFCVGYVMWYLIRAFQERNAKVEIFKCYLRKLFLFNYFISFNE